MIEKFRVFIKVAEYGSFSQAGRTLELTPSSISRHIDRLESELETKLFNRSTRFLRLTDAGEALLDGARKIVIDYDAVVASTQPEKNEPEGRLRISSFESFGRLQICPLIPKFLAKYPKVKIDITLDNHVVDLYRDDIDLAIRVGNPIDSNLKIRKLVSNKMVVCASSAYLKKHGTPLHPKELNQHNCLIIKFNHQSTYWYFKTKNENAKVLVNGNVMSSGGTPLLEAAKQDLGILMMAEWFVSDKIQSGELVSILNTWESSLSEEGNGDVFLVFIDNKYMKPALRAFIDYIVQHLGHL